MEFIHLDRVQRVLQVFQAQPVEVLGSQATSVHDPLDPASVHFTNVGRRFHGATVAKAFDDSNHGG